MLRDVSRQPVYYFRCNGSEYSTSQVTGRTFLSSRGFRIVDLRVQTAVFAVSVKPEVVVCRPEVVLRPRYHASTCISPSLTHLFSIIITDLRESLMYFNDYVSLRFVANCYARQSGDVLPPKILFLPKIEDAIYRCSLYTANCRNEKTQVLLFTNRECLCD